LAVLSLQVGKADGKLEKTVEIHPSKNISHDFLPASKKAFLNCHAKQNIFLESTIGPTL